MTPPDLLESAKRQVYTVSALTREIREHLETGYPDVWVEGEISNLRRPASGHLYLTLKDEKAQLRTVLFRMVASRLRFDLEDGLKVLARGRLTVYEPRGEYQLTADHLEPMGVGPLELAFQQTCERLRREGLFDEDRKRPLPFFPKRVGIVTSPSGAAVRDILRILHDRAPGVQVLIAPVRVQGTGAAAEIAGAIADLNRQDDVDVIIAGRGGGSIEDLWAFNEEGVARAIFASRIPVISAVGHEVDFTVADFVADARAPTPTAAAEMAVPRTADLSARLREIEGRMASRVGARAETLRGELGSLMERRPFRRPLDVFHKRQQEVDFLEERLRAAVSREVRARRGAVESAGRWLWTTAPKGTVARLRLRTEGLEEALFRSVAHRRRWLRERFASLARRLETSSPLSVLGRGYGICRLLPDLRILKEASAASAGDEIRVDLGAGCLMCGVREVHPEEGIGERAKL
jgi:exodeoxyribonuclease VII large subunit